MFSFLTNKQKFFLILGGCVCLVYLLLPPLGRFYNLKPERFYSYNDKIQQFSANKQINKTKNIREMLFITKVPLGQLENESNQLEKKKTNYEEKNSEENEDEEEKNYENYEEGKNLKTSTNSTFPITTTSPFFDKNQLPATFRNLINRTSQFWSVKWPIKPDAPCLFHRTQRDKNDGVWFDFSRENFVLYGYSAFIDNRTSLKGLPLVRVVVVSSDVENKISLPNIFCRFYYSFSHLSDKKKHLKFETKMEKKNMNPIGMGWNLNYKLAREFIFSCSLPNKDQLLKQWSSEPKEDLNQIIFSPDSSYFYPSHLTLVVGEDPQTPKVSSCLPIEQPPLPQLKQDFVLCVQVAYGSLDVLRLIEWLELIRILGVDKVGLYDQNLSQEARVVLEFYEGEGLVELRRSNYIPHGTQQYMLHGSPVINDCMYRHLHTHKFMFVFDIDEVILPSSSSSSPVLSYKDLLQTLLETYGKYSSNFAFRNQYFFLDEEASTDQPLHFSMLNHRKSVPVSSYGYSMKSLIGMDVCARMHNHYCWGTTSGTSFETIVDVNFSIATNQHYKKCHFKKELCDSMMSQIKQNDAILSYAQKIKQNSLESIKKMKKFIKNKNSNILDNLFAKFN